MYQHDIIAQKEVNFVSTKRINVTEGIKKLIVSSRKSKHLTAADISKAIKGSDYWLQNIENGRTKTINREDLISILQYCLDCPTEEADKLITATLKPGISENLSATGNEKEINLYLEETDTLEDISKYRSQFDKLLENTKEGFNFFFDHVRDKERAISLLKMINVNLHSDLGFIISLYSLPWILLTDYQVEKKREFMKHFSEFIQENKSNSDEREDEKTTTESTDSKGSE